MLSSRQKCLEIDTTDRTHLPPLPDASSATASEVVLEPLAQVVPTTPVVETPLQ